MRGHARRAVLLLAGAVIAACAAAPTTSAPTTSAPTTLAPAPSEPAEQRYPDVVGASAELADDGTWTISATLSSPYDTPERYADAWRVLGPDGTEYAIRVLEHDHAGEQPFTRSQRGISIPEGVDVVSVEGRDLVNGWGGATIQVRLPGR